MSSEEEEETVRGQCIMLWLVAPCLSAAVSEADRRPVLDHLPAFDSYV
jgi:hypothetical protein